ncbi:DUF1269 domain-containing protein [Thermoleophilia bacterium SCSIO 60948]|nr:DUF1269 domain-containing protein [Thermoleophilia bacterium SCSIO 60948]
MAVDDLDELGPVDYLLLEWPEARPDGSVAPALIDLVERGLVRILDLAVFIKHEGGEVERVVLADLDGPGAGLREFDGVETGLLGEEDLAEAAGALEPGAAGAVLVYENVWAQPFATAVRRSGGQLVAGGRISVQAILAALDRLGDAGRA